MNGETFDITPDFVREFLRDNTGYNKLIEDIQFSDERISLCRQLAISKFNVMTPISNYNQGNFPNQYLLLYGTLACLFAGESAAVARNELNYQDGGLQVPLEERFQYYSALAGSYEGTFQTMSQQFKIQANLEEGYGQVASDYAFLPAW